MKMDLLTHVPLIARARDRHYGWIMNAVILAAGVGSRFGDVTRNVAKCMLTIGTKSILEMQLESLFAIQEVEKVIIVVGHQNEDVSRYLLKSKFADRVELIVNQDYSTTNNMYSLFLASNYARGQRFLLCNGDVALTPKSVLRFSNLNRSEILTDTKKFTIDNMKVIFNSNDVLQDISKSIIDADSHGLSLDVYKFSDQDSEVLFQFIEKEVLEGRKNSWTEIALSDLSRKELIKMNKVDIEDDPWFEIDNQDDIRSARDLFLKKDDFYKFKFYFFDLDGTLLIDNQPIHGSIELVNDLQRLGKLVFFLTNNSGYTNVQHATRLTSKGFNANPNQVISSLGQTINHLLKSKIFEIFFVGTHSASQDILDSGIECNSTQPQVVVIGNDTELTFEKFQQALEMIHGGVPYILTHADYSRPTVWGPLPDVGAWASIISELSGRAPIHIFGKPDPGILMAGSIDFMSNILIELSIENAVMIGDRLNTDVRLGVNANIYTVLTLSGSTSEKIFQESLLKPNLVVNSVKDLLDNH